METEAYLAFILLTSSCPIKTGYNTRFTCSHARFK